MAIKEENYIDAPFPGIVVVATGSFHCCCILFSLLFTFTLVQILMDTFCAFVSL